MASLVLVTCTVLMAVHYVEQLQEHQGSASLSYKVQGCKSAAASACARRGGVGALPGKVYLKLIEICLAFVPKNLRYGN